MKRVALTDPELGPLTDDLLTRDVRVYQRVGGHRFSSDDMVTAYVAAERRPGARRICDLGCGLGSVLLHLAWSLPEATLVGVEAQAVSFSLLQKNVARNGFAGRVAVGHGDLRDEAIVAGLVRQGPFELVTGTPPYFPPSTALDAEDEQRAYARIEYRGGVEAYVKTAARILSDDGVLVLCGDHEAHARVEAAVRSVGLSLEERLDVFPRVRAPALFSVWTASRKALAMTVATMTLRDKDGRPSADAARLKAFSGFTSEPPAS
ncbi:MAG TPA: methyltransferase [Myxococcota bacterium]|nr:methyltransferase [Myxococcota bacterium]